MVATEREDGSVKRAIKVKPAGAQRVPSRWEGKSGVVISNVRSRGIFARRGGWLRKFLYLDDKRLAVIREIAVSPYISFRGGKSALSIAKNYGVPVATIEDIVRFYLLHPEAAKQDGWV